MTTAEFEQVLSQGENLTIEFKTWIHAKDIRERISLAVDELVAFANAKGGTGNPSMTELVRHYLRI